MFNIEDCVRCGVIKFRIIFFHLPYLDIQAVETCTPASNALTNMFATFYSEAHYRRALRIYVMKPFGTVAPTVGGWQGDFGSLGFRAGCGRYGDGMKIEKTKKLSLFPFVEERVHHWRVIKLSNYLIRKLCYKQIKLNSIGNKGNISVQ